MEICAPLLMRRTRLPWTCWTSSKRTLTSTSSISRRCGAPIQIPTTPEMLACMLTTGKISEGSLTPSTTRRINAPNGKRRTSYRLTLTGASTSTGASSLTAGRSRSTTLWTTRCTLADRLSSARSLTAPTTTRRQTGDNPSTSTSRFSPKTEAPLSSRLRYTSQSSWTYCSMCLAAYARPTLINWQGSSSSSSWLNLSTVVALRVCPFSTRRLSCPSNSRRWWSTKPPLPLLTKFTLRL